MWETLARFCPLCGLALAPVTLDGLPRLRCEGCGFVLYANPASASCAVVLDRGEVCLVKRKIDPYRGHWTLPAGFQEYFETPEQAAIRETREECGLEIEIVELFGVLYTTDDARKRANLTIYLGRPIGGALCAGDDAEEARFFPIGDLPAAIGFENNRRILETLARRAEAGDPLGKIR